MMRANARLSRTAVAALVAVVVLVASAPVVEAGAGGRPATSDSPPPSPWATVRVVAQRLADGRTEFALQHDPRGFAAEPFKWGESLLPIRRFFPAAATVGRWLASSPLTVSPASFDDVTVRIVARLQADERIEFAVQQQLAGGSWANPLLPTRRFFPANVTVGRWLVSSPVFFVPTRVPVPLASTRFIAVDSGSSHACGLRIDGTVNCWGNNLHGQASAPDGQFSAVSAGGAHSCGVRADGTVNCWGHNLWGQASAPDGQFSAVSAGTRLSCGVRRDATAVCWGGGFELFDTGLLDPPLLVSAVSAGSSGACGLVRDDGSGVCVDDRYEIELLDGPFSAISEGPYHRCWLRPDETVVCSGGSEFDQDSEPDEVESMIFRVDRGQTSVPEGRYKAVSAGLFHSCGLRVDGTITCWGSGRSVGPYPPESFPSDGQYTAVTAGGDHSCALRSDGTVTCWGGIRLHG